MTKQVNIARNHFLENAERQGFLFLFLFIFFSKATGKVIFKTWLDAKGHKKELCGGAQILILLSCDEESDCAASEQHSK